MGPLWRRGALALLSYRTELALRRHLPSGNLYHQDHMGFAINKAGTETIATINALYLFNGVFSSQLCP